MKEEDKTTNDLYRELINLQAGWREETKGLLHDQNIAIQQLAEAKKKFDRTKYIIPFVVLLILILSTTALIWNNKIKICSVTFKDVSMSTDNCIK